MKRIRSRPRANLDARAAELGFGLITIDGEPYWDESAYYAFTLDQIEQDLEAPSAELAEMALALVSLVVRDERRLARLGVPEHAWDLVRESWSRTDPSLYGRFDLAYDGAGPAKLLEYNADTPTALYEAAVFQWFWKEDLLAAGQLSPGTDQFNSIHEKLVARFAAIAGGRFLHLTAMADSDEDRLLVDYLADCARQAGMATHFVALGAIGLETGAAPFIPRFVDDERRQIDLLFKLYPWEWVFADSFGQAEPMRHVGFIEPAWKAILSNKGILPMLWDMEPGHPNLLPAFFEDDPRAGELGRSYARKPLHSREGANVTLYDGSRIVDREGGTYGAEGFIRQALAPIPNFDGNFATIGSWIVGDEACGIGIREDATPITKNTSRFVPHVIVG